MHSLQSTNFEKRIAGKRLLIAIIASEYAVLVLSVINIGTGIYIVMSGPKNNLMIAGEVMSLTGVSALRSTGPQLPRLMISTQALLTMIYLILHDVLPWRYRRASMGAYRRDEISLRCACLVISGSMVLAWLAASVLALINAFIGSLCEVGGPSVSPEHISDACKVQLASVAGTLLSL